jgi:signal peptidase I
MHPNPTYVTYTGPSMKPILRAGDLLEVTPYNGRQVRCGDTILFFCPEENRNVVHRVVALGAAGIKTMGDNNLYRDPWFVTPEQIAGYVTRAQRGRRWYRIPSGFVGLLAAGAVRTFRSAMAFFSGRRLLTTRIVVFRQPQGTELHLLLGRRVIGVLPPGQSTWVIRRPFRFFVDETSLPTARNGVATR